MCGIVGAFGEEAGAAVKKVLQMTKKIRHRGPDWSGLYVNQKVVLAHERLCIVDPQSGKQPLKSKDGKLVLVCNGEIYNHRELRLQFKGKYDFLTESDCEIILALYKFKGIDLLQDLNGIFAFVLYDEENDLFFIARDHCGIIPLYIGYDNSNLLYVASELKALEGVCSSIEQFKPQHYYSSATKSYVKWYHREWREYENVKEGEVSESELQQALEAAVRRQLMTDVPYGVLLSGGLDSSIIAAVAKKFSAMRIETDSTAEAWWPRLHSFAVGLPNSPDLIEAQKVADHIGTVHHSVHITIDDCLNALHDVIFHIETYDVTTVRASTPMYLLGRYIKSMGVKMVLSGEGADEIFGGYLYFHKAPDAKSFHEETVRKLDQLHLYDCLRANKALATWGVEGRVPFLDKEFLDVAMRLNPEKKMARDGRIEKWILRKVFGHMLPESIAWRQKEQFSDGVGYSWIDTLKKITTAAVSDEQMSRAADRFPVNPPLSKEEYYYRCIFEEHFPSATAARTVPSVASVACCTSTALEWDNSFKNVNDPSGRAVCGVHDASYIRYDQS